MYSTHKLKDGIEAEITNYGGIIMSLKVPDKDGNFVDVVHGFDSVEDFIAKNTEYFGALIGRYGNRIANGKFKLNGEEYTLAVNNGPNSLHGGKRGFDKVVWNANEFTSKDGCPSLELTYRSEDGEEGYPGNLDVTVVYKVMGNALHIEYSATADKDTVLNLTNHSYFNFDPNKGDILGHMVEIDADRFTPVDSTLIPTGELRDVEGTPFDFRNAKPVSQNIGDNYEQLKFGNGYDHNFALNCIPTDGDLWVAARAWYPPNGIKMTVLTDQPGLQFYTGNFLKGEPGKGGKPYNFRSAMCFETQHFPDSPNHHDFPSTVLKAGERFFSTTIFDFSIKA